MRIAPLQVSRRFEPVILDAGNDLVVERRRVAGYAKGAVIHVPAGPTGDLCQLGHMQRAMLMTVEFLGCRKGDMVDIHVEAHADGIGCNQKIDFARLIERDLGVARAWRERPHHDGRATTLTPDQFRDGIDPVGRKGDDRRSARQSCQLLCACPGQLGEARPDDEPGLRQQFLDQAANGFRAEHHGLGKSTCAQQAIGEGVAAFPVGGELDFVDGQKFNRPVERHRLDGADEIAGCGRQYLFFAGDQSHMAGALHPGHAVIDLARQQTQGQTDHACLMRHHPFDGEMGLAGVCRAQHRGYAAAFSEAVAGVVAGYWGGRDTHVSGRTFGAKRSSDKGEMSLTLPVLIAGILGERTGSESLTVQSSVFVHG